MSVIQANEINTYEIYCMLMKVHAYEMHTCEVYAHEMHPL